MYQAPGAIHTGAIGIWPGSFGSSTVIEKKALFGSQTEFRTNGGALWGANEASTTLPFLTQQPNGLAHADGKGGNGLDTLQASVR